MRPGVTRGWLLNGRVRHDQPTTGFRSGIEPVLLAAAVPARPGDVVLEGGSGVGAGLLCLVARVTGVFGVGVEVEPSSASLARANARAGDAMVCFVAADLTRSPIAPGRAAHAFANPPYHDGASGPASPDAARRRAKTADVGTIGRWVGALAATLGRRGTLTLCVPAALVPACVRAFAACGLGSVALLPLWPREGVAAKLVLIRAVQGGRAPFAIKAGLVLHEADGRFTPAADAILRAGDSLPFD